MELIPLCTLEASLADVHVIGTGPAGMRTVADVSGGTVSGDRLSGSVILASQPDTPPPAGEER